MKIVVIGPTYPFAGGISHYNTLLCKNLAKKHDVTLISYKRRYPVFVYPGGEPIDNKSKKKIKMSAKYILDTLNPITWIQAFLVIKKRNPDMFILHWVSPFMTPIFLTITSLVKLFIKAKILFICHNVLPHERKFVDKFLTKLVLRNSDYFIVHSKEDLKNLKLLIPKANVKRTVHPAYEVFKFGEISQREAKEKLRISDNSKIILHFGYIRKYKGLIHLIDAMPDILKEINANLLIVGKFCINKERYIDRIKKYRIEGNVRIVDEYIPNEEVGVYFSAADVIVLPYTSATQSGIIPLAYAFNKPVITTNVGGLPDVVKDGKTGLIVKPCDPGALSKAIISYFKANKEKEFRKNIEREKKRFSWDKMIEIIEEFNNKLN